MFMPAVFHENLFDEDVYKRQVDCSYCIYSVCIEPSRKGFPLEQYNYLVTVWYISVSYTHLPLGD